MCDIHRMFENVDLTSSSNDYWQVNTSWCQSSMLYRLVDACDLHRIQPWHGCGDQHGERESRLEQETGIISMYS